MRKHRKHHRKIESIKQNKQDETIDTPENKTNTSNNNTVEDVTTQNSDVEVVLMNDDGSQVSLGFAAIAPYVNV